MGLVHTFSYILANSCCDAVPIFELFYSHLAYISVWCMFKYIRVQVCSGAYGGLTLIPGVFLYHLTLNPELNSMDGGITGSLSHPCRI